LIRLVDHLKTLGMSNREARAAMGSGKVWVGGIPMADAGREIEPDQVSVRNQAPRIQVGRDLVVLYRDPHLAMLWKPPRMLSVPAPRRAETNVLAEAGKVLGSVLAVHRLDEGTSGLMMTARTAAAQAGLKDLLESHDVERRYLAIVQGRMLPGERTVSTTLIRNRGDGLRGSGEGGKPAVTHLRMVEAVGNCSLVEATLQTGRTHQVRIHLSESRHPVLGDSLYGGQGVGRRAPRLALHAWVLGFVHPITGESKRFTAPLADDLELLRRQLKEPRHRPNKAVQKGKKQKKNRKPKKNKKKR